jgi:competence protein ComFC
MKKLLQRHLTAFLDLVYPRVCEVCEESLPFGREHAGRSLCDLCLKGLPRIVPPFCDVCAEPYDGAITDSFRCGNCAGLKLHFDHAVCAYRADDAVRELVHRFKYQRELHLRGVLGALLAATLEDPRLAGIDQTQWLLVPVPLHHARRREREYNQAWELCREMARSHRLSALEALQRVRATVPQASLTRHQRLENLQGAFRLRVPAARLTGRNVLLVDDVLTTGSTASECARILRREAGVQKVVVLTVARG